MTEKLQNTLNDLKRLAENLGRMKFDDFELEEDKRVQSSDGFAREIEGIAKDMKHNFSMYAYYADDRQISEKYIQKLWPDIKRLLVCCDNYWGEANEDNKQTQSA